MRKYLPSKHLLALPLFFFLIAISSQAQTVVSPANTGVNWFTGETTPDGMVSFVNGPGTPPLGCGSLQLSTSSGTAKAQYLTSNYMGTRLSNITALNYWSYRNGTSTNPAAQTISLNLQVDVNGAAPGGFTTLVFEPAYQSGGTGAIMPDVWQQWDAYNGGNAIWWSTQAIPGVCAIICYVTWNTILASNPDAVIIGGLGFNIGTGWLGQFTGAADVLTVGVSGTNTTYNFDPLTCQPDNDRVVVCHKGKDLTINRNALPAHLGHGDRLGSCSACSITARTGIEEESRIIPTKYALSNYPNPFTSKTTIQYSLPQEGKVSVKVYDLIGRELLTIINAEKTAGIHTIEFDASKLKAGVYYYRLTSNTKGKETSTIQKMIVK